MEINGNNWGERGLGRQLSRKLICEEMFDGIKYPIDRQSWCRQGAWRRHIKQTLMQKQNRALTQEVMGMWRKSKCGLGANALHVQHICVEATAVGVEGGFIEGCHVGRETSQALSPGTFLLPVGLKSALCFEEHFSLQFSIFYSLSEINMSAFQPSRKDDNFTELLGHMKSSFSQLTYFCP